jgi:hypothetical protein
MKHGIVLDFSGGHGKVLEVSIKRYFENMFFVT